MCIALCFKKTDIALDIIARDTVNLNAVVEVNVVCLDISCVNVVDMCKQLLGITTPMDIAVTERNWDVAKVMALKGAKWTISHVSRKTQLKYKLKIANRKFLVQYTFIFVLVSCSQLSNKTKRLSLYSS